jgi:hypothetical protein
MGILEDLDEVGLGHLNDLVDQVKRGQCVLFLGAGVSNEVGLPSGWELTTSLAKDIGIKPTSLSQIAQAYQTRFDRARLIHRLRQLIEERPIVTRGVTSYDLVPEIKQFRMIFTTNWDDQIERAFHRKGFPIVTVRFSGQVSQIRSDGQTIVKLHGDFGGGEIILTRADYEKAYQEVTKPGGLFNLLANSLSITTVLFVGYSLEDDDFRLLYEYVRNAMGAGIRTHYAVMRRGSFMLKKEWAERNIVILETKARDLFEYIAHQVCDFVNREQEIRYVIGPDAKPLTEFFGIVGSGKTELLKKIEDHYRLDGIWLHAFIDLDGKPNFAPLDISDEISLDTLGYTINRNDILARAKDEFEEESVTTEQINNKAEQLVAEDLVKAWVVQRVVLLFDASEQISDVLRRWIEKSLFPALQQYIPNIKGQVRVVFAGRKPISWETPNLKQNLNRIALSPFDEMAVGDMLDRLAAFRLTNPWPYDKRYQIIQDILNVTGGHPGCIKKVFHDIAQRDFDVQSDYVNVHKKEILKEIMLPTFKSEILRKVQDDLHPALEIASVFRRLFPDFLDVLMEKRYLDGKYGTGLKLLGNLCETYVVWRPRPPAQLYDIDPLVRHFFVLQMELLEAERFRELNSLAMAIYDHAIIGQTTTGEPLPYPPGNELRVAYTVEAMYHFLTNATLIDVSPKEILMSAREKIEKSLETLRTTTNLNELTRLLDMLEARFGEDPEQIDHELLALATKLFPDDGYHIFLKPIKEFRKRWLS